MAWAALIPLAIEAGKSLYNYADSNYGAGAKKKANEAAAGATAAEAAAAEGRELAKDPYGASHRASLDELFAGKMARGGVKYGDTSLASGVNIGPVTHLSRAEELATKARQSALSDQLFLASQGKGPSIAGMQMQQNTEAALAANRAAAAGIGRGNAGLAMRQLGQQQSAQLGQASMGSAALKAQEAQSAQAQLAGLTSAIRAQDFAAAKAQADYAQAHDFAQAGFNQQTQLANAGFLNHGTDMRAQVGLANEASRDDFARWWAGSKFAQSQADRDAALRAWAARNGFAMDKATLDFKQGMYDQNRSDAKTAAMAQGLGMFAMMSGGGGSGGGGGGMDAKFSGLT